MTLRAMRSLPLCLSALSVLLTGCTLATTAAPNPLAGTTIGGKVYGGQNPVNGAKVYLLAVNPAAYGSASLSLLTAAGTGNAVDTIGAYATSDTLGNFALTGDYSCTKGYALGATTSSGGTTLPGNEQIYLYALGGDSGSGSNTSIGLLAALGPCNAQYSSSLQVNEITTVAAAYALAGFATDATHISSSGTTLALTGLTNAGLNSANLVSVATGAPVASSTGITRPVATLYTLADILAACVNSSGATASCSTLFQYTESSGATGTPATDTATAAINLAHNPYPTSAGMSALFPLAGTNPPFVGGLSNQPNDFTVSLTYTGNGLTSLRYSPSMPPEMRGPPTAPLPPSPNSPASARPSPLPPDLPAAALAPPTISPSITPATSGSPMAPQPPPVFPSSTAPARPSPPPAAIPAAASLAPAA
jgi:hypothetical protein